MCGILGISYNKKHQSSGDSCDNRAIFSSALDKMRYRGPDDTGILNFDNGLLGHVRLSIQDLSSNGAQPMESECKNYAIVFNGEIYNFKELKEKHLKDQLFKSSSDSEVLLKLIVKMGFEAIKELNGMFAFAFLDRNANELYLCRDRFGIKPLYYFDEQNFAFSSTVQSLNELYRNDTNLDNRKILEYLYFGVSSGENTVFPHVKQVTPGTYLKVKMDSLSIKKIRYIENDRKELRVSSDFEALAKETRALMSKAVERQLVSDTPVAIFLSGGIDSSIIAYHGSLLSQEKISTFSAKFGFSGDKDHSIAEKTSRKFGTNHRVIEINENSVIDLLKEIPNIHSLPFSDYATIPLLAMSKEVQKTHKVVLQGDGGDELFGGYRRYQTLSALDSIGVLKKPLGTLFQLSSFILPRRMYSLKRYLAAIGYQDWRMYAYLMTTEAKFKKPDSLLHAYKGRSVDEEVWGSGYKSAYLNCVDRSVTKSYFSTMLDIDSNIVLPELFFRKVDEATMGGSIEARVPFMDNDLVEFANSLPNNMKVRNRVGKWLLRYAYADLLPKDVFEGNKRGFTVPVGSWLTNGLSEHFHLLINDDLVSKILNVKKINELYLEQKSGFADNSQILWRIFCLALWIRGNVE